MTNELLRTITSDDRDVRNRSLDQLCRGASAESLLGACAELDRFRRASGRRDDVERCRTRTSQVLVWKIQNTLIVRVGVDGRHQTLDDSEFILNDFRSRCQAVCGARRIGKDMVFGGIVHVFIDAQNHREIRVLRRRCDDDFLRAGVQMLCCAFPIAKYACPLNDDLNTQIFPR